MPDNKNHHFVPQFYLRNFGAGDGRSISLFNLARKTHAPQASVKGQCQRPWLYGRDLKLEKALGVLEGHAARVFREVIASGVPPQTDEDCVHLIAFVAFQWGRTPAAGEVMNAVATKLLRATAKASKPPDDVREHVDSVEVKHATPAALSLTMTGSLGPVLFDLEPRVLVNDTRSEFITSDSPVVLFNQWCRAVRGMGTTGMASSGLQIFLPVSPRHVVLLFDRDVYSISDKGKEFVTVGSEREVCGINALQLLTAEHNLYHSGRVAALRAIDALPLKWRDRRGERVVVHRAVDAEGASQMLHLFQEPPDVTLDLSFIRVLRRKKGVPLEERARSYREAALAIDRDVRPEGEPREPPTHRGPWFVVEKV